MNNISTQSVPDEDWSQLTPITSTTLREQVTQSVRSALMNGHFKPGQLVTVKSLCEKLNSSIMPTREAVNRLIAEGALELRANRTVTVPTVSLREFNELTELRCLVEGLAGAQAIDHFTPSDLERLKSIEQQMIASVQARSADAYLHSNAHFHFSIYRLGTTPYTFSIIEKLWVRVGPLIRFCLTDDGMDKSNGVHQDMIHSLKTGNAQALSRAIQADIMGAASTIRNLHDLWVAEA